MILFRTTISWLGDISISTYLHIVLLACAMYTTSDFSVPVALAFLPIFWQVFKYSRKPRKPRRPDRKRVPLLSQNSKFTDRRTLYSSVSSAFAPSSRPGRRGSTISHRKFLLTPTSARFRTTRTAFSEPPRLRKTATYFPASSRNAFSEPEWLDSASSRERSTLRVPQLGAHTDGVRVTKHMSSFQPRRYSKTGSKITEFTFTPPPPGPTNETNSQGTASALLMLPKDLLDKLARWDLADYKHEHVLGILRTEMVKVGLISPSASQLAQAASALKACPSIEWDTLVRKCMGAQPHVADTQDIGQQESLTKKNKLNLDQPILGCLSPEPSISRKRKAPVPMSPHPITVVSHRCKERIEEGEKPVRTEQFNNTHYQHESKPNPARLRSKSVAQLSPCLPEITNSNGPFEISGGVALVDTPVRNDPDVRQRLGNSESQRVICYSKSPFDELAAKQPWHLVSKEMLDSDNTFDRLFYNSRAAQRQIPSDYYTTALGLHKALKLRKKMEASIATWAFEQYVSDAHIEADLRILDVLGRFGGYFDETETERKNRASDGKVRYAEDLIPFRNNADDWTDEECVYWHTIGIEAQAFWDSIELFKGEYGPDGFIGASKMREYRVRRTVRNMTDEDNARIWLHTLPRRRQKALPK